MGNLVSACMAHMNVSGPAIARCMHQMGACMAQMHLAVFCASAPAKRSPGARLELTTLP
jgi:hypothetical protein